MDTKSNATITVETTVNAPVDKVWEFWTNPVHIVNWNNASDDWHTPYADNNLRPAGKFKTTMAAKDGSLSFDFEGTYTAIQLHRLIEYNIADGRRVKISFIKDGDVTRVIETFDPERTHSIEMQQGGWQAILDNFKKYTEAN